MIKTFSSIIAFNLFFCFNLLAKDLKVSILSNLNTTKASVTIQEGTYTISAEGKKNIALYPNDVLHLLYKGKNKIQLIKNNSLLGSYTNVNLLSADLHSTFRLNCLMPKKKNVSYENNLQVNASNGALLFFNRVELNNYVEGVIESEIGMVSYVEALKVQAIICRTYALKHLDRHKNEGFELCDKVHCQVYHGKSRFNNAIKSAVDSTADLVIVDKNYQLIEAVFHSNCGGQTCNSEDIWSKSRSYLRSVPDTFCTSEKQAVWERTISKSEWLNYLSRKSGQAVTNPCTYQLSGRLVYLPCCKVTFEDVRTDFKLKSTFFGIEETNDRIVLKGRGFGHGVGMCQEGAIKMASLNYTYSDIIHHYYTDVLIDGIKALNLQ